TPRLRYSGASLGYQFASIIAGGPAPLIATALFAAYRSGYAIALYILACAVISFIATALLPDYTNRDVSREYDGVGRPREGCVSARAASVGVSVCGGGCWCGCFG